MRNKGRGITVGTPGPAPVTDAFHTGMGDEKKGKNAMKVQWIQEPFGKEGCVSTFVAGDIRVSRLERGGHVVSTYDGHAWNDVRTTGVDSYSLSVRHTLIAVAMTTSYYRKIAGAR